MKIPRRDALQARLEELGLLSECNETMESLERRVARFSLQSSPVHIPESAASVECFGFFYDEEANGCPHSGVCELREECFVVTRNKMEDLIFNKKPRVRW